MDVRGAFGEPNPDVVIILIVFAISRRAIQNSRPFVPRVPLCPPRGFNRGPAGVARLGSSSREGIETLLDKGDGLASRLGGFRDYLWKPKVVAMRAVVGMIGLRSLSSRAQGGNILVHHWQGSIGVVLAADHQNCTL